MMTREKFKDLVYKMLEHDELYNKLLELGIDTIDCKYLETPGIFFDALMQETFGIEGADLVSWWMYENVDHKIYAPSTGEKEFYYPGEEIHGEVVADLDNIDDLYDYIVKLLENNPKSAE